MADAPSTPRALICLLPGLGDAMIASPVVRAVRDSGYVLDALTMLRPVTEYARALEVFDRVDEVALLQSKAAFSSLFALRRRGYDLVCVPAPATRWQYAAVALAIGGKRTILHRYGGLSSAIARAGKMMEVELRGGHRIAENRRLAEALGMQCGEMTYLVPGAWNSDRRIPGLLGLHTGSMSYKGNEQKRWPLDRFAQVARRHAGKGRAVRAFFGPNESTDAHRFADLAPMVEIVERPLADAARAISECEIVLANDSGLAHLAAGLGVTTLVLFGMTDPARCKPIGPAIALRPTACPPCFDEGQREFTCVLNIDYRCLNEDMPVDYVERAIEAALCSPDGPAPAFDESGPFALYGRSRA